jgi:PPM family protein phosphatase
MTGMKRVGSADTQILFTKETMKTYSISRQGLARETNQDRLLLKHFLNSSLLAVIADGMGGHAAGDVAAYIATDCLSELDSNTDSIESHLVELVEAANMKVLEVVRERAEVRGMGTTLTALFLRENRAHWAHVGDTRITLLRDGSLIPVTEDHTIPGLLLKKGEITREAARVHPMRNMLVRCIGCTSSQPDTGNLELKENDLLLLSSDGLHDALPDTIIESILKSQAGIEKRLSSLVEAALQEGSQDDISVLSVEL